MKKKIARERLPVYEMVVDEEMQGIKYLSIVENPAIEVKGYAFDKGEKKKPKYRRWSYDLGVEPPCHDYCQCEIINGEWFLGDNPCEYCMDQKQFYDDHNLRYSNQQFSVDKDQQIIAGPAMIPHREIYRSDESGEYYVRFSPETIRKAVAKFTRGNNNDAIDVEHSHSMVKAFIMEHWIVRDSVYDASNTYGFKNLPVGTWFVVMKIEDKDFWEQQVRGENKRSFSIEGLLGRRLVKMSVDEDINSVLDSLTDDELLEILKDSFSGHENCNCPKTKK